jgi:hypothetical protein
MRHGTRARLLLAPVIGLAGLSIFGLWPSDARVVRGRVKAAAEAVSARPGEADIERLARIAGLSKLLAPDILVEEHPGGPAVRGRDTVVAVVGRLSAAGGPQQVELSDITVVVDDAKSHATVIAVAHVSPAPEGLASSYDSQPVRVDFVKDGSSGEWLISRATFVAALDR